MKDKVDMLRGDSLRSSPLSVKVKPQSSPTIFQKTPSEYMKFRVPISRPSVTEIQNQWILRRQLGFVEIRFQP